jgi:hypothetical protein
MEYEDMEECIKKQDDVVFNRDAIQQDRLRRYVESIRHQRRLNHDKGVVDIFLVKNVSEEIEQIINTKSEMAN